MRSRTLAAALMGCLALNSLPDPPAEAAPPPEPVYGAAADRIGTFDGRVFWFGWNASFSETYEPISETYAWVVYVAPEAVYLALQSSEALYSGIDVNAGIGKFFGTLVSPEGDTMSWDYLTSLSGVALSKGFTFNAAPIGPLSGLGIGYGCGVTMMHRDGALQRAIQFDATASATFELITNPFPVSASLDRASNITGKDTGFWPILIWDVDPDGADSLERLRLELQGIASRAGDAYADTHATELARMIIDFLERIGAGDGSNVPDDGSPENPVDLADLFDEFLQHDDVVPRAGAPGGSLDRLLVETQEWLDSGDTGQLPDALRVWDVLDEPTVYADLQRLEAATGLAFELGYRRGYDSTGRDDNIYADAVERVLCPFGETCSITVTSKEIAKLLATKVKVKPADLEGVTVWFDHAPDAYLSAGATSVGVPVKDGRATYTFTQSSYAPFLMGIEVPRVAATSGYRVILADRLILCDGLRASVKPRDMKIGRGKTLKVRLRDADGARISEFTVDVDGCGLRETIEARRGQAVLKKPRPTSGGVIRLRIRAPGYDDCVRTLPVRDAVAVRARPGKLKLGRLEPGKGKTIKVSVRAPKTGKVAGADVHLFGCGVDLRATTDGKGRATFVGVEPIRTGTMTVAVAIDGDEADARPTITVVP
jgi:hypothetical protein